MPRAAALSTGYCAGIKCDQLDCFSCGGCKTELPSSGRIDDFQAFPDPVRPKGHPSGCPFCFVPLGCLFVFIILVKQTLEYRKERGKENGLAVCLYALGLLLVLTVTYFELSK